jgi:hypothetical protein
MYRNEIINREIKLNNYQTYLEIGVENGYNFKQIIAPNKFGADPDLKSAATHKMTSDDFFKQNNQKFDIIFIDGLHHAEQVYLDICNSVKALNEGGTIVLHDLLPENEAMQAVPRIQNIWTGDCWKGYVQWRKENWGKHRSFVINTDFGVGIIKLKPTAAKCNIPDVTLNWNNFAMFKERFLSLIPVKQYIKRNW